MKTYQSRQVRRYLVREDTGLACASRAHLWRRGRRIGDNVEIILNNDSFANVDKPISLFIGKILFYYSGKFFL